MRDGGVIPTYARETMFRVPAAPDAAADRELQHRVSRQVFERALAAAAR